MQVRLLGPVDVVVDGEPRPVPGLRRKAVLATLALAERRGRQRRAGWSRWSGATAAPPTAREHAAEPRVASCAACWAASRDPRPAARLSSSISAQTGPTCRLAERLLRPGPAVGRSGAGRAVAAGGAGPVARAAAGRPGRAALAGGAGRAPGPARRGRSGGPCSRPGWRPGSTPRCVPELEQLVADRPLDEQVQAQLMLALYRSGRQADALAAYQRLRRTLDEELGIDPSQELRDLETAILRQDPAARSRPRPRPRWRRPHRRCRSRPSCRRRCRPSPAAGRSWPASTHSCRPTAQAGPGPAGRGGHRGRCPAPPGWARPPWPCTGRTGWPHGSPTGSCTSTCKASTQAGPRWSRARRCAGSWRRSACPRPGSRPTLPAQAALYRSLLAGKRVLVVLDNARDVEQVRAAAARLARLPGRGDQPRPAHRAGRHRRRLPADPGSAARRRRPRPAHPAPGTGPGGQRAGRGRRHHRRVRAAAAGPDHRRRPRRHPAPSFPLAALAAELREATARARPVPGRRSRHRRPGGVLLVLPRAQRQARRGCSGCSACTRARISASPPRPAWPRPGRTRPGCRWPS